MSRRLVLDDGRTQRDLVVKERITIGRDPSCDVSDADPRLSRRHAEFLASAHGLIVRDLESRNGIRVNGRQVHQAPLSPGDLVEIAHLVVRFLDDDAADPAGAALPTVTPTPVEGVHVRAGFEDDRTRVLPAGPLSTQVSGTFVMDRPSAPPIQSAGEIAINPVAAPAPLEAAPRSTPPRLGVTDLLGSRWGWRVLGQGVLLACVVFLMTALPMLNWFSGTLAEPVSNVLLLRMLGAPLLAAVFAGVMAASLIARTTARALERDDHS